MEVAQVTLRLTVGAEEQRDRMGRDAMGWDDNTEHSADFFSSFDTIQLEQCMF